MTPTRMARTPWAEGFQEWPGGGGGGLWLLELWEEGAETVSGAQADRKTSKARVEILGSPSSLWLGMEG